MHVRDEAWQKMCSKPPNSGSAPCFSHPHHVTHEVLDSLSASLTLTSLAVVFASVAVWRHLFKFFLQWMAQLLVKAKSSSLG